MPRLTDREQIRAILETDRPWAAYAIADLEPGFFECAHWFCAANDEPSLALCYAGFGTPVIITVGRAEALQSVLHETITAMKPHELYAAVKPGVALAHAVFPRR